MVVYLGKATPASGSGGSGGEAVWGGITGTLSDQTDLADALSAKQATLVSGTNIKTINDQSLLGSGNITISGSVPNQNTAVGATTPLEFWEGTSAEYNSGGGNITYYNWQYTSSGGLNTIDTGISFMANGIAYGNGKYIAVGYNGKIYSSTNKTTWAEETSGVNVYLSGIAYGNGKFVAVGDSGTIISSSGNGTWTAETSGTATSIKSIAFGNNLFACSDGSNVYYSSGNGTWNSTSRYASDGKIMFCTDRFCIVLASSEDSMSWYTSTDASTWTSAGNMSYRNLSEVQSICGSGDYVYVVAREEFNDVCWAFSVSSSQITQLTNNKRIYDVVNDSSIYYAVTAGGIESSSNGTTFTSLGSIYGISYLCYGDALVGVSGDSSSSLEVMTYSSATTYNVYTTDENPTTSSVVYSDTTTQSALTITSVGTDTITLSDTNTYNYNSAGNQTVTQTVGEAHPDWICLIEGVGIKKGSTVIAQANATVDQTYNASSTNAQSGVAVASGISDTLGTINTQLESIIAQGD